MEITEHAPGSFCWVELITTDDKAAKTFYKDLFQWGSQDNPIGPEQVYSMLRVDGKDIGAMYQMNEEQKRQNVPPHWLSYISVVSVDETVNKAKELGGTLLHGPMDVFTAGRMAMLQDPTGAVFALWQPNENIGARVIGEPNAPCWNEFLTNDVEKGRDFYTRLFGWGTKVADVGGFEYTEFSLPERPAAGMMAIQKEWGQVPPHWLVYFAVTDCDTMVERAKTSGAAVLAPPCDIPGVGRFATLEDPQGASFSVIKLDTPVQRG